MERTEAVAELPAVYQRVLTWLDAGRSADDIATSLGLDRCAVEPLIQLAEAKLARLTAGGSIPVEEP